MVKRITLVAGIIVLLACIVLPPVFGARARSLIELRLNAMAESLPPDVMLAVWFDNWETGWFSSTATVTVEATFGDQGRAATVAPDLAGSYRTTMPRAITLRHGPVLVGDPWGFGWGSAELSIDATTAPDLKDFLDRSGVEAVARLTALVSFLGGATIAIEVPPIRTTDDGSTEVRFAGLDATVSVSPDGMRGSSSGTLHRLGVTDSGASGIELGRLEWAGEAHRAVAFADSWLGNAVVTVERVSLSSEETSIFEMDDARFDTATSIDDNTFVGTNRYTANRIRFGDVQLDNVELDVAATYPARAAARLAAGADAVVDEPSVGDLVADALRERITLRIDPLSFRHADMPFKATLNVDYRGDRHGDAPVAADFATLARVTSAELEASMHKDLVRATGVDALARLLPEMARLELVLDSGDEYRFVAAYRDGELLFDGKPVDFALLVALMAGA